MLPVVPVVPPPDALPPEEFEVGVLGVLSEHANAAATIAAAATAENDFGKRMI
jgi:hypothetical protein